jgi:hypothetical protein
MRRSNARFWSILMVFAVMLASVAAKAVTNGNGQAKTSLTGTWITTVAPDPSDLNAPPPFTALITFTADGNLFTTETDEQAISQGVWASTGPRQFLLTAYQFEFDTPNVWDGTFKIRAALTLDSDGMHYQGPYRLDFFDTAGNAVFTGVGTLSGQRVVVEPMP